MLSFKLSKTAVGKDEDEGTGSRSSLVFKTVEMSLDPAVVGRKLASQVSKDIKEKEVGQVRAATPCKEFRMVTLLLSWVGGSLKTTGGTKKTKMGAEMRVIARQES
jgi:hypothetical protein